MEAMNVKGVGIKKNTCCSPCLGRVPPPLYSLASRAASLSPARPASGVSIGNNVSPDYLLDKEPVFVALCSYRSAKK